MLITKNKELTDCQLSLLYEIATTHQTPYTVHRPTVARLEKAGLLIRGDKSNVYGLSLTEKGKEVLRGL